MLPKVYNVNFWLRGVAEDYAKEGYTVLAPDMFWRQQPDAHLGYDQPERARLQGNALDIDRVVADVGLTAARLREVSLTNIPVGVNGFCLGGRLAALAGVREDVQAIVSYYGVRLEEHASELAELTVPAVFHFGEIAPWVPLAAVGVTNCAVANLSHAKYLFIQT